MKLLKLFLFLVVTISVVACGKDDDTVASNCTQTDWIGEYEGTQNCDGVSEDVTVTITASGTDAVLIEYETDTVGAEFDPLTPVGCAIDKTSVDQGVTLTIDADLNVNSLTLVDIITSGTTVITCTITATRK